MQGTELLGNRRAGQGEKKLLNNTMGIVWGLQSQKLNGCEESTKSQISPGLNETSGNRLLTESNNMVNHYGKIMTQRFMVQKERTHKLKKMSQEKFDCL